MMKYAILDQTKNDDGYYAIRRIIVTSKPITSIDDLGNITIDFALNELKEINPKITGDWVYDDVNQVFIKPVERVTIISQHELFQRLTFKEKAMLIAPDEADVPSEVVPILKVFAKEIEVAKEINLDLDMFVDGLNQLESAGLINEGRADEIRGIK